MQEVWEVDESEAILLQNGDESDEEYEEHHPPPNGHGLEACVDLFYYLLDVVDDSSFTLLTTLWELFYWG